MFRTNDDDVMLQTLPTQMSSTSTTNIESEEDSKDYNSPINTGSLIASYTVVDGRIVETLDNTTTAATTGHGSKDNIVPSGTERSEDPTESNDATIFYSMIVPTTSEMEQQRERVFCALRAIAVCLLIGAVLLLILLWVE